MQELCSYSYELVIPTNFAANQEVGASHRGLGAGGGEAPSALSTNPTGLPGVPGLRAVYPALILIPGSFSWILQCLTKKSLLYRGESILLGSVWWVGGGGGGERE